MANRLSCTSCGASVLELFGTVCPVWGQVLDSSHKGHPHSPLLPAPEHGHPIQLLCKCAVNPSCPKCARFQHLSSSTLQSIFDCTYPTCSGSVCRPGVVWPWLIASQRTAPALSSHACSCIALLLQHAWQHDMLWLWLSFLIRWETVSFSFAELVFWQVSFLTDGEHLT